MIPGLLQSRTRVARDQIDSNSLREAHVTMVRSAIGKSHSVWPSRPACTARITTSVTFTT
jgi:hypothetical protein